MERGSPRPAVLCAGGGEGRGGVRGGRAGAGGGMEGRARRQVWLAPAATYLPTGAGAAPYIVTTRRSIDIGSMDVMMWELARAKQVPGSCIEAAWITVPYEGGLLVRLTNRWYLTINRGGCKLCKFGRMASTSSSSSSAEKSRKRHRKHHKHHKHKKHKKRKKREQDAPKKRKRRSSESASPPPCCSVCGNCVVGCTCQAAPEEAKSPQQQQRVLGAKRPEDAAADFERSQKIHRVFDPSLGVTRSVRASGEVVEEAVSRAEQQALMRAKARGPAAMPPTDQSGYTGREKFPSQHPWFGYK